MKKWQMPRRGTDIEVTSAQSFLSRLFFKCLLQENSRKTNAKCIFKNLALLFYFFVSMLLHLFIWGSWFYTDLIQMHLKHLVKHPKCARIEPTTSWFSWLHQCSHFISCGLYRLWLGMFCIKYIGWRFLIKTLISSEETREILSLTSVLVLGSPPDFISHVSIPLSRVKKDTQQLILNNCFLMAIFY